MSSQQQIMMTSNMMNQQHRSFIAVPPTTFLRSVSTSYGDSVLFPWKLHQMLDAAEEEGFTSVVSWLDDNKSFKVHDKETFVSLIMPRFFEEQTKYKSFQRQLNMWGYERFLVGPSKGGYNHKDNLFVRGHKSLCCRMNRLKKTDRKSKNTTTKTSKATTVTPTTKKETKRISMDGDLVSAPTLPPTISIATRTVSQSISGDVSVLDGDIDLDQSNHTATSSIGACETSTGKDATTTTTTTTTTTQVEDNGRRRSSVIVEFLLSEIEDIEASSSTTKIETSENELDNSWHELFPSLDLLHKYSP